VTPAEVALNFYSDFSKNKIKRSALFSYCKLVLIPALFDFMYFYYVKLMSFALLTYHILNFD